MEENENNKYINYISEREDLLNAIGNQYDNETLNSIAKKFFTRWKESKYVTEYNKELLNQYVSAYKVNDKDRTEFLAKKYTFGYVENYPYEVEDRNGLSGITAEYLNRMERLTNSDFITFVKYKDRDSLKDAIKNNEEKIAEQEKILNEQEVKKDELNSLLSKANEVLENNASSSFNLISLS